MDAIWRQMTCLSQQLFYGRWHDQYLYNYFKTKSEKIKRDGIITQKERKSQRKCIYAYFNSIPNFNTWLWQRGFLPVLFNSYSLLCESIFLFGTFFLGSLPVLDECDYIFYVYIPSIFRFKSYAPTPSPGQFWQVLPNNGLWKLYLRISSKQNV